MKADDKKKPTIEELEKIINEKGNHVISIEPDGSITANQMNENKVNEYRKEFEKELHGTLDVLFLDYNTGEIPEERYKIIKEELYSKWLESKLTEQAKEIEGIKNSLRHTNYMNKLKAVGILQAKLQSFEKGIENKWIKNFAVRESVKTLRFVLVRKWKG